jgi:CRP/FNR family transcriptional regulator, dissimilatory nitrate respiration regulator
LRQPFEFMARRSIAAIAFLAALPLFKSLDSATLERLAAATTRRTLKRGEILFRKGDVLTGMYVVVYGEIRLISRTPARGARLTGVVGPGHSFGEPVMFLERPALVEAQAASDALLLHVPKEAVFEEIERSPKFARRMIAGLSQRVEGLVRELERQTIGSSRERFIEYLLRRCRDRSDPIHIVLRASKAAIASQLNLTPEHFSRVLHELAHEGLLQIDGRKITVQDPGRLAAAASSRLRVPSRRERPS